MISSLEPSPWTLNPSLSRSLSPQVLPPPWTNLWLAWPSVIDVILLQPNRLLHPRRLALTGKPCVTTAPSKTGILLPCISKALGFIRDMGKKISFFFWTGQERIEQNMDMSSPLEPWALWGPLQILGTGIRSSSYRGQSGVSLAFQSL